MARKNIVWIRLQLTLLNDYRFTDKLTDSQKLLYISLLLLAGSCKNKIPNDANYIKRQLNLESPVEKIRIDMDTLAKVYPKFVIGKDFCSFAKFDEIHNWIEPTYKGTPSVTRGVTPRKSKNEIDISGKDKYLDDVYLTKDEHTKLVAKFGIAKTTKMVTILDNYKGSSGKKYHSDYKAILGWVVKRMEEDGKKTGGITVG